MRNTKHEDDYEETYRQKCKREGALCLKITTPGNRGYPDRLVLRGLYRAAKLLQQTCPNLSYSECYELAKCMLAEAIQFTELKTPTGRYQPKQKQRIRELRERGFKVDVVRGTEVKD